MDNRNFRRNDRGPIRQRSQLAAFMDKNGIYLVMLVCLALIGVTAYFTLSSSGDTAAQPTLPPPRRPTKTTGLRSNRRWTA